MSDLLLEILLDGWTASWNSDQELLLYPLEILLSALKIHIPRLGPKLLLLRICSVRNAFCLGFEHTDGPN
jgi:hypothetical protein